MKLIVLYVDRAKEMAQGLLSYGLVRMVRCS